MNASGLSGDLDELHMFIFAYLVFSGLFNVLILRERSHFWKSRPTTPLIVVMIVDVALVAAIALLDLYGLPPNSLGRCHLHWGGPWRVPWS